MSGELRLLNDQRAKQIDLRLLRRMLIHFLEQSMALKEYDIVIHLVGAKRMTHVNETYLRHTGSTDVITFDYSGAPPLPALAGELFICVDEAIIQSRPFRTTWQAELVRYLIHGILHLCGHDDLKVVARKKMKREEGRRLREMIREFDLSKLQPKSKVAA